MRMASSSGSFEANTDYNYFSKQKNTQTKGKQKLKPKPTPTNLRKQEKKVYYVQANDPDPYKVVLKFKDKEKYWENPDIFVYKKKGEYNKKTEQFYYEKEAIFSLKREQYQDYHIGCDYVCSDCAKYFSFSTEEGASFLVHLQKNKYVFIGEQIVKFTMMDRFLSFQDWGGRDSTHLPFVAGEKYIYLPAESLVLDKKFLLAGEAPYVQYVSKQFPKVKENAVVPFKWDEIISSSFGFN